MPPSPGVKTRTLREGDGERAHHGQKATVHYMGWLFDPHSDDGRGDEFHNTWRTGEPFVFSLGEGRVIRGLDSGVIGMKVGEIRELTIEADMAFGDRGAGDLIPSGATLVIEIELLGLEDET